MGRVFEHSPMRFSGMPPVIKALVVANIVVFLLQALVGPEFTYTFGLVPARVVEHRWVWQPFTYMFVHRAFFHLLFNLFALWMFGLPVEMQWGPREFLKFYLLCGVGAGLINVALTPGSPLPVIGASGAIYGLLVAFGMLYPDSVVYLYFFFPVKAWHMVLFFAGMEFLAGMSGGSPTVANFAHLGGMLIGYVYIRWWSAWNIRAKHLVRGLAGSRSAAEPRSPRPAPPRGAAKPVFVDEMAEIDRILDKILAHGEASLTEQERETLRRHSRRQGHA